MTQVCGRPGCANLRPCAQHPVTPWATSTRGNELPRGWSRIRRQRFAIDGWRCVDCGLHDPTGRLLECDHIGAPDDHRLQSLRTRCCDIAAGGNGCHRRHTSTQADMARR